MDRPLTVDTRSAIPSYVQLASLLRDAIMSGEIGPHEALPSLQRMVQETGLSMVTVRHAVRVLVEEGLVYSVPGWGTFAAPGES